VVWPLCGLAAFAGQAGDLGPALHQGVVRQGLGCALLALAQGVEAIGQLAHDLGLAAHLGRQNRRRAFAASFEHADQVVNHLPHGQAFVGGWVPVLGQFGGLEQAHLASLRGKDPCFHQSGDAGVLGLGQSFGHAVLRTCKAVLLEPGQRPAGVGVEVALLLGKHLVQGLVDQRERIAYRDNFALSIEHPRSECRPPCQDRWPPGQDPPAQCCRAGGERARPATQP
jgi:hypothetical protein